MTRRSDLATGAVLGALFLALALGALGLPYGEEGTPGPAFAPLWLGLTGVLLAAIVVLSGSRAPTVAPEAGGSFRRLAAAMLALVAAIALVGRIGFFPAIGGYLLFVTLAVERLGPRASLVTSGGVLLFVWLVFSRALSVPFP